MKKAHRVFVLVLIVVVVFFYVPFASAHPLGNFTVNQFAGLMIRSDEIEIDFVLDMAEIPAFQEIDRIDSNRNGSPDPDETAAYHPRLCEAIQKDLSVRTGRDLIPIVLHESMIAFPPGQGGLSTLRLNCVFLAKFDPIEAGTSIEFQNDAYQNRLGWREIVLTAEGVVLAGDFSTESISDRLSSYPADLLSNPPDQRQVSFEVRAGGSESGRSQNQVLPASSPLLPDRNDLFTRLILLEKLSLPALILALGISFLWGAMHALTPGHGKTIVGAYLVGSRGTALHALYLGLVTTITHTAGVFVLGGVTMFASSFILPERMFPWLSFLTGILVVVIGVNLLRERLRLAIGRRQALVGHDHHHDAEHEHSHEHGHPHLHEAASWPHSHARNSGHIHSPGEHGHGPHRGGHTHLPPGADGSPVNLRSLLVLGISGGLLPCPSALVVMLSAIALGRVGLGLLLVTAFSFGLAGVLSGMGILFVYAGKYIGGISQRSRVLDYLPAASALFIALVGLAIAARALAEMGVL